MPWFGNIDNQWARGVDISVEAVGEPTVHMSQVEKIETKIKLKIKKK